MSAAPRLIEPKPLRLAERIANCIKETHGIAKEGKNENQGYAFVRESDVMARLRGVLATNGVVVIPRLKDVGFRSVPTKSGQASVTDVRMVFTVMATDTEESWDCEWYGCGADTTDKGGNKAATSAEKYFLLKLLMIPTDADPDKDGEAEVSVNGQASSGPTKEEKREATDAKLQSRRNEVLGLSMEYADKTKTKNLEDVLIKFAAVKKTDEIKTIKHAEEAIEKLRFQLAKLAAEEEPLPF